MLTFAIKTNGFLRIFKSLVLPSLVRLVASWASILVPFGSLWGLFGPSLVPVGGPWAHLGVLLGLLGALLAPFWGLLEFKVASS